MTQRTVGQRVSYWRERRGLSQRELAIRLGKSASWMQKVESGERALERLPVLDALAEALRVDLQVLLGRDLMRDSDMCLDGVEVAAIRRALERYDHLLTAPGVAVDRGRLRIGVHYAWVAFAGTDYGTLGRTLPHLIDRAQAAVATADGDDAAEASGLLAQAYQIASSTLRKLGENELAWLAADRSLAASERSGDPQLTGTGAYRVANALLAKGRCDAAHDLNRLAADRLATGEPAPSRGRLAVFGTLVLQAGIAAARAGRDRDVHALLAEADTAARHVGEGRDDYRTSFGPTNVGVHRVSACVELGDGAAAIAAAARIGQGGLAGLRPERRANHLVDVARAHLQTGDAEQALTALLEAEHLAPAEVRCRPLARNVVTDLHRRSRGGAPWPLRELAERAGLPA
ncbi:helix-turn-helix domain-containing protein [Embleya sp. NPDC050154]|uniref:helix-turn-helix domain-containing protein n=1 Tax=Embleya sp. NPDC050154 TaxID=3363988 RepID=UPI0037A62C9E